MKHFTALSLILILLGIVTKSILNLDDLIADNLSSILTSKQLIEYFNFKKNCNAGFIIQ